LGYDPFAPVISSSAVTSAAVTASATTAPDTPPASNSPAAVTSAAVAASSSTDNLASQNLLVDESIVFAVDSALSMLLSVAQIDDSKAQTAIQTIHKMLSNLAKNKSEVKFRTIRLENPGFQQKVATVDGGLDLMFAAGYHLHYSQPNAIPVGASPRPLKKNEDGSPVNDEEEEVCYLLHTMDEASEHQLDYCLRRYDSHDA
jgi:hypothetical protein